MAGRQLIFCLSLGVVLVGACQGKQRRFATGPFDDEADASNGLVDEAPAAPAAPSPFDGGKTLPMETSSEALGAAPLTPAEPIPGSSGCGNGGACSAPCEGCALLELGELCSTAADCASGFCALATDGVDRCCDQGCTGIDCVRCSVEGSCVGAPTFAAECTEVLCPSDDVCRDYDPLVPAGTCSGEGACATQTDCAFQWTAAARDGAACECTESSCTLVDGEACTRDEDCTSGACRASLGAGNVCCAQSCGAAEVCRDDGSRCELAPVCTNGQPRCSGSSFQLCTGGQWVTQRECGVLGCDTSLGGCRRSVGQACSSSSECGEGACRQAPSGASICCTAACDAACRVCSNTGTSCQFLPDDAACGTITCPGDSTCRDYPAGITTNRCRNGNCGSPEAVCTFTARNSGQSCSGSLLCDGQGNCAVAKKSLGATCSSGAECGSNNCVDGVCCNTACDGPCMECNRGNGLCNIVPADSCEQEGDDANVFDCSLPSLPRGPVPIAITLPDANPQSPAGGSIANGDYTLDSVVFFSNGPGEIAQEYLALRDGFFDRNRTTTTGAQVTEARSVGTYTTMGTTLVLRGTACRGGIQYIETLGYTATNSRLDIFRGSGGAVFSIEGFSR